MLRWLCVIGVICVSACASTVGSFAPGPVSGPNAIYQDGAPLLLSRQSHSELALGLRDATLPRSQRIQLLLMVQNLSEAPVTVGPGNMRVSTETGVAVRIFSAEDIEREARQEELEWAQYAASSQADMSIHSSGRITRSRALPSYAPLPQRHITANARSHAFQEHMIAPGSRYFALVTLGRLPRGSRTILIELDVGGEVHRADFVYSE